MVEKTTIGGREIAARPEMAPRSVQGGFTYAELVAGNPMLIEVTRFRRKFLSLGSKNPVGTAVVVIMALLVVGGTLSVLNSDGRIRPMMILTGQMALFALLGPLLFYGSVAGERERRSWDLLMAAPVTKSQIVAGKWGAALAGLLMVAGALVPATLLAGLTNRSQLWSQERGYFYSGGSVDIRQTVLTIVLGEILSVAVGLLVCGMTIFFSARVRRPLMALVISLGATMSLAFLTWELGNNAVDPSAATAALAWLNPFYFMGRLVNGNYGDVSALLANALVQITVFFGLAATLFYWTVNTLTFAENDVKFIPRDKEQELA